MNWNDLSMSAKSDLMKLYLKHGITSLDYMKEHYNKYAEGGHLFDKGGKTNNDKNDEEYTFVTPSWGNTGYVVPGTTLETSDNTRVATKVTPDQKRIANAIQYSEATGMPVQQVLDLQQTLSTTKSKNTQLVDTDKLEAIDRMYSNRAAIDAAAAASGRPFNHSYTSEEARMALAGMGTMVGGLMLPEALNTPILGPALETYFAYDAAKDLLTNDRTPSWSSFGKNLMDMSMIYPFARAFNNASKMVAANQERLGITGIPTGNIDELISKLKIEDLLPKGKIKESAPREIRMNEAEKLLFEPIDTDSRFRFFDFDGLKRISDLKSLSKENFVKKYPDFSYEKSLYDIGINKNNNEHISEAIRHTFEMFPISRDDFDVISALNKAKALYEDRDYISRFKQFGEVGDNFIKDAKKRLEDARITASEGTIRGPRLGGLGADGMATFGLPPKNTPLIHLNADISNSSNALQSTLLHEANHISHGMEAFTPNEINRWNHSIRPKLKDDINKDSEFVRYIDGNGESENEIISRAKTALIYAKEKGLSIDEVVESSIYDHKIPRDIRELIEVYDKDSLKRFLKGFAATIAAPIISLEAIKSE